VTVAFSETFEAFVAGLQRALWERGGVPSVLRSDNLSAATHELPSGGRELNRRFQAVLDHYGVRDKRRVGPQRPRSATPHQRVTPFG
jgi:hypothetical protein